MVNKKILIGISMLMALLITLGATKLAPMAKGSMAKEPTAHEALLMDYNTGAVLYEKNAQERRPIASMVKIMTLLLTFEDIDAGKLHYDDDIMASENAASMGGSQAFLDANNTYKLNELIKSIVVASANDSCVAVAENSAGSVENFVERMNGKAQELGLSNTYFVNCTGLPAPNQYSCAADVAVMTRELISHKDFFNFSKIWMFDFVHPSGRVTGLSNTNKLLKAYEGCDGGKTGFTSEALSCLSATAKRGDTRLISVIVGAPNSKERNKEVAELLNYGFANYETKQLVFGGIELENEIEISGGKEKTIKAAPAKDFFYLVEKGNKPDVKIETVVDKTSAPVAQGEAIGKITVSVDGKAVGEVELVSCASVKKLGYMDVVDDMIHNW